MRPYRFKSWQHQLDVCYRRLYLALFLSVAWVLTWVYASTAFGFWCAGVGAAGWIGLYVAEYLIRKRLHPWKRADFPAEDWMHSSALFAKAFAWRGGIPKTEAGDE